VASRDILNEKTSLNHFLGKAELEHRSNLEKLIAVYLWKHTLLHHFVKIAQIAMT
jgi:hypothetical protein